MLKSRNLPVRREGARVAMAGFGPLGHGPGRCRCVGGRAPRAPSGMQLSSRFSRTGSALQAQTASSETVRSGYTIDPAYAAGAAYLKAIGFTNAAEIARILDVAMNPNSLFLDSATRKRNASARILSVEEDMQPVVDFLLSVHVSKGDMLKIISAHPPVLSYSVPQRLQPFVEYLQELGIQDVGAAISNRPSLLGLDANQQIRKMVEYLQSVETPPELIITYLLKSL
ncbi:hypothetical protein V8C86DRAFT_2694782 [Haematococcus lacustris]